LLLDVIGDNRRARERGAPMKKSDRRSRRCRCQDPIPDPKP